MQGFERSVGEIVESVWQSLFEAGVVEEDPFRLSLANGKNLAGQVRIAGAWEGIIGLQCSEELARKAAVAMLALDPASVTESDWRDALGELTNMVGGNFKALLPEPCTLSMPIVTQTTGFQLRVPGYTQVLHCPFRSGDEIFAVSVLQSVPAEVRF